jgi:uncharacterized membrane protein YcaP (DUF421 family)
MFFDSLFGLLRVVVISTLAYASLVIVLRLAGKRSLAKLNAFDLVITVAFGSTLATVLLSKDVSFLEGVLAFVMLALLQWLVTRLSIAWPPFKHFVRSRPRLLLENGEYREAAMAAERITHADVNEAIRSQGVGRIEEVGAVVLETDGTMSIIRRSDEKLDLLADVKR